MKCFKSSWRKMFLMFSFLKCLLKVKSTLNPAPRRDEDITKTFENSVCECEQDFSDLISAECLLVQG